MHTITSFFIGLFAVVSGWFSNAQDLLQQDTETVRTVNQTQTASSSTAPGSVTYINPKYGYSIVFPPIWSQVKIQEKGNVASFGIEDQDRMFIITAYTKKEWSNLESEYEFKNEPPLTFKFKESENYVFTYQPAQDYTNLALPFAKNRSAIMDSFSTSGKLTESIFIDPEKHYKISIPAGIIYSYNDKSKSLLFWSSSDNEKYVKVSISYLSQNQQGAKQQVSQEEENRTLTLMSGEKISIYEPIASESCHEVGYVPVAGGGYLELGGICENKDQFSLLDTLISRLEIVN